MDGQKPGHQAENENEERFYNKNETVYLEIRGKILKSDPRGWMLIELLIWNTTNCLLVEIIQ